MHIALSYRPDFVLLSISGSPSLLSVYPEGDDEVHELLRVAPLSRLDYVTNRPTRHRFDSSLSRVSLFSQCAIHSTISSPNINKSTLTMLSTTYHDKLLLTLTLLPSYLPDIHTLHSLLLTSQSTRRITLASLTPYSLFKILAGSRIYAGVSQDWYLLSLISPGFASWLARSSTRRKAYKRACPHLPQGFLDLALSYPELTNGVTGPARLTLDVMRKTTERKELVNAVSDLVDRCVGIQWESTPRFWDEVEDAATLEAEPEMAVWQMLVYGEMFGQGLSTWLDFQLCEQGERDKPECQSGTTPECHRAVKEPLARMPVEAPMIEDWEVGFGRTGAGADGPTSPFVGIALRCEFGKYAMADLRTPLHHDQGPASWGLESDWGYPASLLSSEEEDEAELEEEEEEEQGQEQGQGQSENQHQSDHETVMPTSAQPLPPSTRVSHYVSIAIREAAEETDGNLEGTIIVQNGDQYEDEHGNPLNHRPFVHQLRKIRNLGYYRVLEESGIPPQHASALIHLLKTSPLWARISSRIRRRACRLADPQEVSDFPDITHALPVQEPASTSPLEDLADQAAGYEDEGFGKTVTAAGWRERPGWKQTIWEDALWTSGWDGLEVIADQWEWTAENHKAHARRKRRTMSSTNEGSSLSLGRHNTETGVVRIEDDHPALRRLVGVYAQLQKLKEEPPRIEFRSIARPARKIRRSEGPVLVGDLDLMVWDPMWHG